MPTAAIWARRCSVSCRACCASSPRTSPTTSRAAAHCSATSSSRRSSSSTPTAPSCTTSGTASSCPTGPTPSDELCVVVTQVDRALRRSEELLQQRGELVERHRRVLGVERRLVEVGAELLGEVVVGMAGEPVAQIAVEAEEVEEVVTLENAVL